MRSLTYRLVSITTITLSAIGCGAKDNSNGSTQQDEAAVQADSDHEPEEQLSNDKPEDKIPVEALNLHEQARQSGTAGDYDKTIQLLQEAQAIAPDWPYPTYDMAFTYLLMKEYESARKYYGETVKLAPRGFFTAITALDTLNREAEGELPAGTYTAYLSIEWTADPEQKKSHSDRIDRTATAVRPGMERLRAALRGPC
ncbi:MAG: hypothetical protein AAGB26_12935 [Planctomycetota bacterium]